MLQQSTFELNFYNKLIGDQKHSSRGFRKVAIGNISGKSNKPVRDRKHTYKDLDVRDINHRTKMAKQGQ